MRLVAPASVVLALLLSPAAASAQSLGEIAAREKEKKEKAQREGKSKPPAKVFTEGDLRGQSGSKGTVSQPGTGEATAPAEPSATASPKPAAEGGEKQEKTEEEKRAEAEQAWREKLQKARQDVQSLTDRVNRLQTDLNDVSGNLYGATRTNLLNRMEAAKKELAAAQQAVADLEEEGRRSRYR